MNQPEVPARPTTADLDELNAAIGRLAPAGASSAAAAIDDLAACPLVGVEHDLAVAVSPTRLRSLRAGRALVRRLAATTQPIGRASNGAPVVAGGNPVSIAHDATVVVAIVGPSDGPVVGIDVEPFAIDAATHADLEQVVFAPAEERRDPLVAFVAKEAVYKAWSRPGRPVIGFDAVTLTAVGGAYRADIGPSGAVVRVAIERAGGRLLAVATSVAP